MTSTATALELTAEQWTALPEDEPGELVHGQLAEEEVPDLVHEIIVVWFTAHLRVWLGKRGFVAGSEAKFVLGPRLGRKPDVSLFLKADGVPPRRGAIRSPPHLMIEVISAGGRDVRRDRVEKPSEYATFGLKHLWLVDPEARTLECFALGAGGQYVRSFAASEGSIQVPGFEGLVLDLDALWEETAELGD